MKTLKTLLSTIILVALPSIVGAQQPIERLRRPELLRLFAEEEYGIFPTEKVKMKSRIVESSDDALGGIAKRRQIELTFSRKGIEHKALMLVYLPAAVEKAPMFMALNFNGNHTISAEDAEIISTNDAARGASESRWPLRKILSAGYGLATAHYYDFFPDDQLGCPQSIYRLFDGYEGWIRHGSQGGAIAAWSWGLSRMLDVLEKLPGADARRAVAYPRAQPPGVRRHCGQGRWTSVSLSSSPTSRDAAAQNCRDIYIWKSWARLTAPSLIGSVQTSRSRRAPRWHRW